MTWPDFGFSNNSRLIQQTENTDGNIGWAELENNSSFLGYVCWKLPTPQFKEEISRKLSPTDCSYLSCAISLSSALLWLNLMLILKVSCITLGGKLIGCWLFLRCQWVLVWIHNLKKKIKNLPQIWNKMSRLGEMLSTCSNPHWSSSARPSSAGRVDCGENRSDWQRARLWRRVGNRGIGDGGTMFHRKIWCGGSALHGPPVALLHLSLHRVAKLTS